MSSPSPITHIVLFRYAPSLSWSALDSHFSSFIALKSKCLRNGKPYMKSLKMGKNRSWEPFSKGMTHGFVLEFDTQADLDYYLTEDPVHLAFSQKVKEEGLVEDSVVVDILDGHLSGPTPLHPLATHPSAHTGSCHCQALTFLALLPPTAQSHILCHCQTCRQLSGAPYSCNQILPATSFRLTSGVPKLYVYKGASGKDVRCYLCGECGSHVYHEQDAMPGKVIVRTLLLEGGEGMPTGGEIFAEGRLGWVKELRDAMTPGESGSETG